MTGDDIIAEARTWKGTPWKHQKYLKGVGCDCLGLVGGVALALNIPGAAQWRDTPAYHDYGRQPDPEILISGADLLMDRVVGFHRVGYVLVMSFEKEPQHFAFVSELNGMQYMIHALAQARKVVETRYDEIWEKRTVATYRFRGIEWPV